MYQSEFRIIINLHGQTYQGLMEAAIPFVPFIGMYIGGHQMAMVRQVYWCGNKFKVVCQMFAITDPMLPDLDAVYELFNRDGFNWSFRSIRCPEPVVP